MSEEAIKLAESFGGNWADHPTYGREDWRIDVAENNTSLSYWDWVLGQLEN